MDEKEMVSVWIFNLLFRNVFPDALEYLSGICRCAGSYTGGNIAVDI